MVSPTSRIQEAERLAALERYDVLDSEPEEAFDRITRLAGALVGVPIVLISLVDSERQWFKSAQGLEVKETPRSISFCTHAIQGEGPFVVENALTDDRFQANPLVQGDPSIRFYAGVPLQVSDGYKLGTLCVIDRVPRKFGNGQIALLEDLARMVVDQLELRRIATTDGLTGAMTRGFFLGSTDREVERAKRHGRPLSVAIMDIDHFKSINDTHGHPAGDAALRNVVSLILERLRSTDLLGRVGGEEFALCLPETAAGDAVQLCDRLRAGIEAIQVNHGPASFSLTASFGVTTWEKGEEDILPALKRADEALYRAKQNGRNRVVSSQS